MSSAATAWAWPSARPSAPPWAPSSAGGRPFLSLAGFGLVLAVLGFFLLPSVRRIAGEARPSLRAAIAQPGVKPVAIAWPLLVLAHFALFTYIAPYIRDAGLPDYAISLSLTVLGVSGLLGIWIAGLTVDSHPRRSLLITTAAIAVSMLLLPFVGGSLPFALVLMTVWGAGLGAIGIYNQSAILRAGRENKDAANGLTVLTIQLGITIGALYGSAALVVAGPLLVPAAAALPVIAALVITYAGKTAAYPPGPRESVWKQPRPVVVREGTR